MASNGEHYKKIKGTAMGTKVAPTFANIFMGKFENDHVYTHPLYSKVLVWLRFIDDILFIFRPLSLYCTVNESSDKKKLSPTRKKSSLSAFIFIFSSNKARKKGLF